MYHDNDDKRFIALVLHFRYTLKVLFILFSLGIRGILMQSFEFL